MKKLKKGMIWAILAMVLGVLLYVWGVMRGSLVYSLGGGFILAGGIFIADLVLSDKWLPKPEKENK